MSKNFIYESFEDYLNYVLLIESEEGCKECNEKSILEAGAPASKPDPWEFQFSSGKYKASDVNAAQKKALENDFLKRVVPVLNDPRFVGQKLKISVEAASSKVPIKADGTLAQELKKSGYSVDNKGLCQARSKTVSDLIFDILYKNNNPKGIERKKFGDMMKNKVEFIGVPKPDIGPDFTPGKDNPEDSKYKENQYISALLQPSGGKIRDDLKIKCNADTRFEGGEATEANGFKGYNKTVFIDAKSGTEMKITFDPKTVPDSIFFSYFGEYKLSPFAGGLGRYYVSNHVGGVKDENYKPISAKPSSAGGLQFTEIKFDGKTYLASDYKKYLNDTVNKGGKLVASIESTLKSLGIPPIKEICPEFFDANGKIEVYSIYESLEKSLELDQKKLQSGEMTKVYQNTVDLIKGKAIPASPIIKKISQTIRVTKNIASDAVTLVAFSPVSGTVFNISSSCTPPKA